MYVFHEFFFSLNKTTRDFQKIRGLEESFRDHLVKSMLVPEALLHTSYCIQMKVFEQPSEKVILFTFVDTSCLSSACFLVLFRASLVAQMVKHLPAKLETQFDAWVGKIPWRRE